MENRTSYRVMANDYAEPRVEVGTLPGAPASQVTLLNVQFLTNGRSAPMSELEEATVDSITLTDGALLFPTIRNPQPSP